jgi:hypothetical protein
MVEQIKECLPIRVHSPDEVSKISPLAKAKQDDLPRRSRDGREGTARHTERETAIRN